MKSHEYEFAAKDAACLVGWPLIPVAVFAVAMHCGARFHWLPDPRPTLDTDRTILCHQAEAARSPHTAGLLLIGDSSCLMDVSAVQLGEFLGAGSGALNLGTLSYLDLHAYSLMLRHYFSANPGRVHQVILLMHPEALRRAAPTEYHLQTLNSFYEAADFCDPSFSQTVCWLGGEIFNGRLLSRAVPLALDGNYGKRYGFTKDLWQYLSEHQGSALDPGNFDPKSAQGNAEYRLSKQLESASRAFKSAIPPGVKLFAGITPAPQTFVNSNFTRVSRQILRSWNEWLQADVLLEDLPPTLPDELFASTAHLNERGQRAYTEMIGRKLAETSSQK